MLLRFLFELLISVNLSILPYARHRANLNRDDQLYLGRLDEVSEAEIYEEATETPTIEMLL